MKLTKSQSTGIQEGDFTPMIDMVFQLIAFFMVLLNFNEADVNEEISLPLSVLARPPDGPIEKPITLHLRNDAGVMIGAESVPTVAGIKPYLRFEVDQLTVENKKPRDATVIIRADRAVPTGKVQELIKVCQESGFEKFALRAREEVRGR
jgi:biopolymer transport protein ExbD